METEKGSPISDLREAASPSTAQSSSLGAATEHLSQEAPYPCSVMDAREVERKRKAEIYDSQVSQKNGWLKGQGIRPSISLSDFVDHMEHCISEQMPNRSLTSGEASCSRDMLDDIMKKLLSDTELATASNEKSLMRKVNSLCCLLQNSSSTPKRQETECCIGGSDDGNDNQGEPNNTSGLIPKKAKTDILDLEEDSKSMSGCKKAPTISRKDSFGNG